jgi:hypothetical protein
MELPSYKRLDATKSEVRLIEILSDGDDGSLVKYEHSLALCPLNLSRGVPSTVH